MATPRTQLFTSESVSMGHPDKVADQISDAILDAMLADDRAGRVACETLVCTGLVVVAGEITTTTYVNIPDLVRETSARSATSPATCGFDADSCGVLVALNKQSADIAMGVDKEGAGDQGMMFGFACNETAEFMPLAIQLSHRLVEQQAHVRAQNIIPGLRPDAKSQVTVEYDGFKPVRVDTVVLSTQHDPVWNEKQADLKKQVIEHVIKPVLKEQSGTPASRSTSTPPAASRSAAPTATPASPAARSSSTPTAAWVATAAAPSPARTRPRSTAPPRTWPATSPRTSSPRASPTAARSSSPTPSASPSPPASGRLLRHRQGRRGQDQQGHPRDLPPDAQGDHRDASCASRSTRRRPATATSAGTPFEMSYYDRVKREHRGEKLAHFTWEKTDKADALKNAVK